MRWSWPLLAAALLLASCGRPTDPMPSGQGASEMTQGPVFVDSTELLLLESYPVQVHLHVKGSLPTPCHTPVWSVKGPDEQGRLDVELHSEAPTEPACVEVLQDLDLTIPLGAYTEADFTVYLNGDEVGPVRLP